MVENPLMAAVVAIALGLALLALALFGARSLTLPAARSVPRLWQWAWHRLGPRRRVDGVEPPPDEISARPGLTTEPVSYAAPVPSRLRAGGILAPPRPAPAAMEPQVLRLVIDAPRDGAEREHRLPAKVVAGSGWHGSFFHGWCGTAGGARPAALLNVRAVTLRGATHAGMNTEGQDAIGAAWDESRSALYVAVADGLGSLPRSGRVATEAITAALHLCTTRPGDLSFADGGTRMFEAIGAGLLRSLSAGEDGLAGACTLVVAEVIPRFDGAEVTVLGVGDSEAWALFDGRWTVLHHERGGADNATRDLPTHAARPKCNSYQLSPGSVLLLGSDGFTGALDISASPLARGLARLWRRRPGWLDFVNHVSFVDEYWSDDRSAVAVWIGEGAVDG